MSGMEVKAAPSDIDLLDRCLEGDNLAAEELAVLLSRHILGVAMRKAPTVGLKMSREDLKDFNQDILLALFEDDCRRLRSFGRRSSLMGWVAVIVTNALIDRKRSLEMKMAERTTSLQRPFSDDPNGLTLGDILPDLASNPRDVAMYKSLVESVRCARIEALSEEERLILDLWCSRLYTEKEMGALLGMNPNTVATNIRRAQVKILTFLKRKESASL